MLSGNTTPNAAGMTSGTPTKFKDNTNNPLKGHNTITNFKIDHGKPMFNKLPPPNSTMYPNYRQLASVASAPQTILTINSDDNRRHSSSQGLQNSDDISGPVNLGPGTHSSMK